MKKKSYQNNILKPIVNIKHKTEQSKFSLANNHEIETISLI